MEIFSIAKAVEKLQKQINLYVNYIMMGNK